MPHSQHRRALAGLALFIVASVAAGCEYAKSSNPVSPVMGEAPPAPEGGASVARPACTSGNPEALVACIAARYSQYTGAGVNEHQRVQNMAFLRDRIIEAGICGGLDLAWNRKRGDGPHSIDALAWRTPSGHVDVVDLGVGYDDTGQPLQLQWMIVAGPPGYDTYQPRPNCG